MDLLKDYQKFEASPSIITRDVETLEEKTGNLYEAITIVSKRANQIGTHLKQELDSKLQEFASVTDSLEEIFENREQIEISKMYERLPKPTVLAMEEMKQDKVYFRRVEETAEEAEK